MATKFQAVDEIPAQTRASGKENELVADFLASGLDKASPVLSGDGPKLASVMAGIRNFLKKHPEVPVKVVSRTTGEGDERGAQIYFERTNGAGPGELDE